MYCRRLERLAVQIAVQALELPEARRGCIFGNVGIIERRFVIGGNPRLAYTATTRSPSPSMPTCSSSGRRGIVDSPLRVGFWNSARSTCCNSASAWSSAVSSDFTTTATANCTWWRNSGMSLTSADLRPRVPTCTAGNLPSLKRRARLPQTFAPAAVPASRRICTMVWRICVSMCAIKASSDGDT